MQRAVPFIKRNALYFFHLRFAHYEINYYFCDVKRYPLHNHTALYTSSTLQKLITMLIFNFIATALYAILATCLIRALENYDDYRQGPKWFLCISSVVAAICGIGMFFLMFINGVWWHPIVAIVAGCLIGSVIHRIPYAAPVAGVLTWILLIYQLFVNPAYLLHF